LIFLLPSITGLSLKKVAMMRTKCVLFLSALVVLCQARAGLADSENTEIDQFVILVHPCCYEALKYPLTDPYRALEEEARQRWLRAIPTLPKSTFVVQMDYSPIPSVNQLHKAMVGQLGAGHVTRVPVRVVGSSTPDPLKEFYEEIKQQINQQMAAEGLTFDPATAKTVIWGESFEGCAAGYGSAIASYLGMKTPTRFDYNMSVPDAPFLLKAAFLQTVSVPASDVEAYLFDLNDGRLAALFRSTLTPQWLDNRNIKLQLDPTIFSVITKQGAAVWPPDAPPTEVKEPALSTVEERLKAGESEVAARILQPFTLSTVQSRFLIAPKSQMAELLSAINESKIVSEIEVSAKVDTAPYVCRDAGAGGYQAFPDICRLQDGRLMAVFYAGYGHVSLPNVKLPKGGRISYCTSNDEGSSWSKAETLYDGPEDDRDPSIVQLKNGQLICSFFQLRKQTEPDEKFIGLGTWIIASADLGKTWSEPRKLYDGTWYCSSPIRELSDGRLILPLYRQTPSAGAVGISDDGGETWSKAVDIDNGGHRLDAETDIIELTDGALYAVQREAMCSSVSRDRGETWSVSKPIDFAGHSPYLHRTNDGIIVLGYRALPLTRPPGWQSKYPCSTKLRTSLDECQTWSDEIPVDAVSGAYPSMVNLKDGSVLIVYYEEGSGSSIRAKRFRASHTGVEWLSP